MLYQFKNGLGNFVFWSNCTGDLHRNGAFTLKDKSELPNELQVAYNNLWSERYPVSCYLAEFNGKYGIALELSYDMCFASDISLPYEELVEAARDKAVHLVHKYPEYDIIFGEDSIIWSDFSKDTVILVLIPWNEDENKAKLVAKYMDSIGYKISKDEPKEFNNNQLRFEEYKSAIGEFISKIEAIDANLDVEKMSKDDCGLFLIIRQCRNKLIEVHNKINDPDWEMPTPFKED